jgi:hypothetical protein
MAGVQKAKLGPSTKRKEEPHGTVPTVKGELADTYGEALEKEKLQKFSAPPVNPKAGAAPPKPEAGETYMSPTYRERLRKFREAEREGRGNAVKAKGASVPGY